MGVNEEEIESWNWEWDVYSLESWLVVPAEQLEIRDYKTSDTPHPPSLRSDNQDGKEERHERNSQLTRRVLPA